MKTTTETLSLAQFIKKPIPLAALTVLVAAEIYLALIAAGIAHVGALGFVVVVAVAMIAIVALILAMTSARQSRMQIKTTGDFSPGDVGGDYSVGQGASVDDKNAPTGAVPREPSAGIDATSIETKGSHSPGRVGGDYSVHQ